MLCIFKQVHMFCLIILVIVIISKILHNILGTNLFTKKSKLFCHYETLYDILTPIHQMDPEENSIFFHETSCRGSLTSRQACAVESAALQHPNKQIFVLFSAPLTQDSNLKEIYNFDNVQFARIHPNYSQDTAVNTFLHRIYNKSAFANNVADVLKFVTLSKYGGIYLDLDTVVIKPLYSKGRNWVAMEDEELISIGAMAFARNKVGSGIVMNVFEEMKRSYDSSAHGFGRNALTKAIQRYCNVTHIKQLNETNCKGFKIYDSRLFYPIHWSEHLYYFKPGYLRYQHKDAFMHHMWERLTYNITIENSSPYTILAKNYCPKTYELFIDDFGGNKV